jgi:hypothetical protein
MRIEPEIKGCFFCGRGNVVRVVDVDVINRNTGEREKHPMCHVCFNKARMCREGLKWNNRTLAIDFNRWTGELSMGEIA